MEDARRLLSMSNTIEITDPETGELIASEDMDDELLEKVFDGDISIGEALDITLKEILEK